MTLPLRPLRLPLLTLFAALHAGAAIAQCTNPWLVMRSIAGTDARIRVIEPWDPDGAGPQPALYVVGGDFTFAGTVAAAHVAIHDPVAQTWAPLGGGVDGPVHAIATLPNGELVIGGAFTTASGVPANGIARWNGATWSAMPTGFGNTVRALHVRANGDLIASVGTDPFSPTQVARWNGTAWSAVGAPMSLVVMSFAPLPNGDLLAGGASLLASEPLARRWNGTTWSSFGGTPTVPLLSGILVMLALPNGYVLAGGSNVQSLSNGVATNVALWNGASWSSIGFAALPQVYDLALLLNGDVVAGCQGSASNHGVRRWNSTTGWSLLGTGLNGEVDAVRVTPNGTVLAGGNFARPGVDGFKNFATWSGAAWAPAGNAGAGPGHGVSALMTASNGDLVAAWRDITNNVGSFHVGRWNGSTWTSLGTPDNGVTALAELANGDLIAGGYFSSISGVAATRLARWNGTAWSQVGGGVTSGAADVLSLAALPNGDLVVAGRFTTVGSTAVANIARFDGTTWFPFGPGLSDIVASVLVLPNGELIAGGSFERDGAGSWLGRVGRWNGASWQGFGSGTDGGVSGLTLLPNGDLVVGGYFTSAGGTPAVSLARWNGTWSAIGSVTGSVGQLLTLPDGDVVAAGDFTAVGGVPASRIARWNGASWSPFGSGLGSAQFAPTMAWLPTGDLAVGGSFLTAGGVSSPYLARLSTTCRAAATSTGTSCTGAGGTNVLTALSLPWLGSTLRSRATGFAPSTIAVHVLGGSMLSLPLPAILPQGVPGCSLSVTPDVLDARVPIGGAIELEVPIHTQLAFVGFTFHQQVVALELSATGDIVALTSTNGLALVKGAF